MQKAMEDRLTPMELETLHSRLLDDRLKAATSGETRNVMLVPDTYATMLAKMIRPTIEPIKAAQMARKWFTFAVLAQPGLTWLTGQFLEPFIRSTFDGAGFNLVGGAIDDAAYRRVVRKAIKDDPAVEQALLEVEAQNQGLLLGKPGANIHRDFSDFDSGFGEVMARAHGFKELPVFKQTHDLIVSIPESIFAVNYVISKEFGNQAIGKTLRDWVHEETGSWRKTLTLQEKALADVRKGLVNTPNQQALFREFEKKLGKYDNWGPTMKLATQTLTPFLPWVLSALRFVYWTMPAHHTFAFASLAMATHKVQAEWEAIHKDMPPGLQNALPTGNGQWVDLGRFNMFGITDAINQGEYKALPGAIAPMLAGPQAALEGKEWTGKAMEVPKTAANPEGKPSGGQKIGAALYRGLAQTLWGVTLAQKVTEKGEKAYGTSTAWSPKLKPEQKPKSLVEILNPIKPFEVKPKGRKRSGLGTGLGGGLGGGGLGTGLK